MNVFDYRDGALHAEGVDITDIVSQVGTPFYCYSSAALTHQYEAFASAMIGLDTTICFAVKANSNQAVIRTFADLGAGADVVSEGELRRALAAGVPADRIIFSGVGKTRDELAYALAQRIHKVNVESEPELRVLGELAASQGAEIGIRVNPDVDAKTHEKISTGRSDNKFGIDISRAREIFAQAAAIPGIKPVSVAVHIGSQLTDLKPLQVAYASIANLVAELRADGHDIDSIDLGGGLGIRYKDETPPSFAEYATIVQETMGNIGCRLFVEPGRSLVGNAGILVTKVIYDKQGQTRRFVIVDAAMNDLVRPAMYEAYHGIRTIRKNAPGTVETVADIVGPICETGDTFARDCLLPTLETDDLLALDSAGAYGAVMASTYNTRLLIPEILVKGSEFTVVRTRPTYDELINLDRLANWQRIEKY